MLKIKTILVISGVILSSAVNAAPIADNQQQDDGGLHSYYYNNEKLGTAISRYAKNNGLELVVAADAKKIMNNQVNGRFSIDNRTSLMESLSHQYGFSWFIYSGTLYINSMKTISQAVSISPEDMPMLKSNLLELGILDRKFGYSEIPSENKIVISGPANYVGIVVQQISRFSLNPVSQKFAVFKLNYAKSSDTLLNFNSQDLVIPGVATILQNMLQNRQKNTSKIESGIEQTQSSQNSFNKAGAGGVTSNAVIQSDDRLNAVIIRDKSANLSIYRDLIRSLDVPTALIQIQVLILYLDQTKLAQAGINWWAAAGNNGLSGGFGSANLTQPSNNLTTYYGAVNPGQTLIGNIQNFIIGVDFLENNNYAKVASKPSLVTTDNIPAIMNIDETLWINNLYSTNSNGNAANNTNAVNFMQVQAINALQITPHVINKNNNQHDIKLSILLEDGSLNDQYINSGGIQKTTQASISSQAIIREGQSLLLAGYTRDINEKVVNSVPGLGDIPLLGWFFKSTAERQKKVSTVYVVTPKIIWIDDKYITENDNLNFSFESKETNLLSNTSSAVQALHVANESIVFTNSEHNK